MTDTENRHEIRAAGTAVMDTPAPTITDIPATEAGTQETVHIPAPKRGFRHFCYRVTKRCFDFVSAGVLFLVLSPVILLLLLIKFLEDFHNPIYVSRRVGKDGREFLFLKIRTMTPGADKKKEILEKEGRNEMDGPVFKIKDDPRITRVGRIYRKFSLDELLQLLNVIAGSMSVVGPRPPIPKEVARYEEWQLHRLDVKGGLLCFWQNKPNRNDLTFDEWVKLDLAYIEQQSIWTDIKIIAKGAWMVVIDHSGT